MGSTPRTDPSATGRVLELLSEIGLEPEALAEVTASSHLREDLGLTSVETTDLQLALRSRHAVAVNLWDREDYTVGELAGLVGPGPEDDG